MKKNLAILLGGSLLTLSSMVGCQNAAKPTDPAVLKHRVDSIIPLKTKALSDSFNAAKSARITVLTDSIVSAAKTNGAK